METREIWIWSTRTTFSTKKVTFCRVPQNSQNSLEVIPELPVAFLNLFCCFPCEGTTTLASEHRLPVTTIRKKVDHLLPVEKIRSWSWQILKCQDFRFSNLRKFAPVIDSVTFFVLNVVYAEDHRSYSYFSWVATRGSITHRLRISGTFYNLSV